METSLSQVSSYSTCSSPRSPSISESESTSQLSRPSSSSSLSRQNAIQTPPLSVMRKMSGSSTARRSDIGVPFLRGRLPTVTDAASDDDTTTSGGSAGISILEQSGERRLSMDQIVSRHIRSKACSSSNSKERKTCSASMTPSPSLSGRSSPICFMSRSRIASIRRESDCSVENEMAHEKLVQTGQMISTGFNEIAIEDSSERKRTLSVSEPISVLTNVFFPQSCSPSPTRAVDTQKQCYSPSTGQVVRNNIQYSPSPSPTPSPRHSVRSMSPIAARHVTKRRYTSSASCELDFDSYLPSASAAKRACMVGLRNGCVSPLAADSTPSLDLSALKWPTTGLSFPPSRLLIDPAIQNQQKMSNSSDMDFQEFGKTKESTRSALSASPSTSAKDTSTDESSSCEDDINNKQA